MGKLQLSQIRDSWSYPSRAHWPLWGRGLLDFGLSCERVSPVRGHGTDSHNYFNSKAYILLRLRLFSWAPGWKFPREVTTQPVIPIGVWALSSQDVWDSYCL